MNESKNALSAHLRCLFYIQIAAIVITLVNSVSNLDSITRWVSKVLSLVAIRTLFQLKEFHPRYRTAALANLGVLICGLLTTPVNSSALGFSSILLLVGSTCAWVADYQEYHGHGELVAELDPKLASKWNSLLLKEILVGLAVSAISVGSTTAMVVADTLSSTITTVVIVLSTVCNLALDGLYLHYMKKTLSLIENET